MSDETDQERLRTACHEAAHSVIQYRTSGFVGGTTTIKPSATGILGASHDAVSDSFSSNHARCRILSCYAGGHSDRKLGGYHPLACEQDDDIAEELLREWGWTKLKPQFIEESAALVERHWTEIYAVAEELLKTETLDDSELQIVADIAANTPDVSLNDLVLYRALKNGLLPSAIIPP